MPEGPRHAFAVMSIKLRMEYSHEMRDHKAVKYKAQWGTGGSPQLGWRGHMARGPKQGLYPGYRLGHLYCGARGHVAELPCSGPMMQAFVKQFSLDMADVLDLKSKAVELISLKAIPTVSETVSFLLFFSPGLHATCLSMSHNMSICCLHHLPGLCEPWQCT